MKYFLKIMTEQEYFDSETNDCTMYFQQVVNLVQSSRLYSISLLNEDELSYCIENFFYKKTDYTVIPESIYSKIIMDQKNNKDFFYSKKDFIKKYQLEEWII
jgi:hypothetical protein